MTKDSSSLVWDTKFCKTHLPEDIKLHPWEMVIPKIQTEEKKSILNCHQSEKEIDTQNINRLIHGDNLLAMPALILLGYEKKINLIYIDPPFDSKADYMHKIKINRNKFTEKNIERLAYNDKWSEGRDSYLDMLYPRLKLMKQLLSDDGCIFVHADWHMGHYIKIMMDEIFGYENFKNEIIWHYRTYQGQVDKYFPRKHDIILFYSKSGNCPFKLLKEQDFTKNIDYKRWQKYLVNDCEIRGDHYPKTDSRFNVFINKWKKENNNREPTKNDVIYKLEGFTVDSVWDIKPVDPKSRNRLLITQKPEALLERIIKSSSCQDDMVADFFAGSGTTLAVAERLNRRWIGCELNKLGIQITLNRLLRQKARPFIIEKIISKKEEGSLISKEQQLLLNKPEVINVGKNKVKIKLSIKKYTLKDIPLIYQSQKGMDYLALMKLAENNFAVLIDYWAVDWDYDGITFKSQWHAYRENTQKSKPVPTSTEEILQKKNTRIIGVRVVDIFGNCSTVFVRNCS